MTNPTPMTREQEAAMEDRWCPFCEGGGLGEDGERPCDACKGSGSWADAALTIMQEAHALLVASGLRESATAIDLQAMFPPKRAAVA